MAQTMDLETAKELAVLAGSCVEVVERQVSVMLHPKYLHDQLKGVRHELDALSHRHSKALGGVVVAYERVQLMTSHGWLFDTNPFIHVVVRALFYIFCPRVGSVLEGVVKKKTTNQLGCLVHGAFNVSVPRPADTPPLSWGGSVVGEGESVRLTLLQVALTNYMPYLQATLHADCEQELLERAEGAETSANTRTIFDQDSGISSNEAEDIQAAVASPVTPAKKKKKKKRSRSSEEDDIDASLPGIHLSGSSSGSAIRLAGSSKKRKRLEEEAAADTPDQGDFARRKKRKRVKEEPVDEPATPSTPPPEMQEEDATTATPEEGVVAPHRKKKRFSVTPKQEVMSDTPPPSTPLTGRKMRHDAPTADPEDSFTPRRKKKHTITPKQVISDASPDALTESREKKKKRRRSSFRQDSELMGSDCPDVARSSSPLHGSSPPPRKKRKIKQERLE